LLVAGVWELAVAVLEEVLKPAVADLAGPAMVVELLLPPLELNVRLPELKLWLPPELELALDPWLPPELKVWLLLEPELRLLELWLLEPPEWCDEEDEDE
jgi:hypothetical protein